MIFHILTIFPEFFRGPFEYGVVGKGMEAGLLQIRIHNLRDWTYDRHKTVDDRPFGGGEGMVLKPGPLFEAVESVWPERTLQQRVILLSAQGPVFDQAAARRLSGYDELLLVCGRYEGVDERVAEHLADEEISIGDFVLAGGEPAALCVVDAVARLLPDVVGDFDSVESDSFHSGLLDCAYYTRPADYHGWVVPPVLLSGHHAEIARFRREESLRRTFERRPDLLASAELTDTDRRFLARLSRERAQGAAPPSPDAPRGGPERP